MAPAQRGRGRGRHRRAAPAGATPAGAPTTGNEITGKRNTQAKNQRYARPLPVDARATLQPRSQPQSKSWLSSVYAWAEWAMGRRGGPSLPTPPPPPLVAYWDAATCSAWVQVTPDASGVNPSDVGPSSQTHTAQELWNAGFFGKGSLSRSEPTWRMRKVNEEQVKRQRERGAKNVFTPEELTAMRRRERMHAKIERARLAVRAGTQLPDGIVALGGTLTEDEERLLAKRAEQEVEDEGDDDGEEEEYGKHIPGLIYLGKGGNDEKDKGDGASAVGDDASSSLPPLDHDAIAASIQDMEWLHVSPSEVFFLAGMLGVLEVRELDGRALAIEEIWARLLEGQTTRADSLTPSPSPAAPPRPDHPFLLSYIAYHHYRSLGWAVKSGVKFCCDWLLYKRGPVFGHAE